MEPDFAEPGFDSEHFLLTLLWSEDPVLAARADAAGIDRIGLDLETLGKAERQRGLGTWLSSHRPDQLDAMRAVVRRGELFCRINPIHAGSRAEVEDVIARGADVLMLPMFTTAREVEAFVRLVDGRARPVPLVEHRLAADRIADVVQVSGLDCIHVGLTDLALSLNLTNRFALFVSPLLGRVADAVHASGLRLCVGGIGRALDDAQPMPSDLVYAQYARLNATGALVSRAFFGREPVALDLVAAVRDCRERMAWWRSRGADDLAAATRRFVAIAGPSPLP